MHEAEENSVIIAKQRSARRSWAERRHRSPGGLYLGALPNDVAQPDTEGTRIAGGSSTRFLCCSGARSLATTLTPIPRQILDVHHPGLATPDKETLKTMLAEYLSKAKGHKVISLPQPICGAQTVSRRGMADVEKSHVGRQKTLAEAGRRGKFRRGRQPL